MSERIWVVEMRLGSRWEPTVGVALNREDGRAVLAHWREAGPDDEYRLVRYEAGAEASRGPKGRGASK